MADALNNLRALNRALTRSVPVISRAAHLKVHSVWQVAAEHLKNRQPSMALAAIECGWELLHAELEVR